MKRIIILCLIILIASMILSRFSKKTASNTVNKVRFWNIQSIDTMKFSRDVAREKLHDDSFDSFIEANIKQIAETGATHVAIATPYDKEFLPFLKRWVFYARKYHLKVWFRGNLSGWENWFDYKKISRDEHKRMIKSFIEFHPELFEDGDAFSSCPECENGGPGDPRITRDIDGFRQFIIDEYHITQKSFKAIDKNVQSNFFSMNGDVAELIMDKKTTSALDGIVVMDHYVISPDKTIEDIKSIAKQSGGKVILGEFGVPIPDIHGTMTEEEQAEWIDELLGKLISTKELAGLNYWTSHGSSTELWNNDNNPRIAADTLHTYYKPLAIKGVVYNFKGKPVKNARILTFGRDTYTNSEGEFILVYVHPVKELTLTADGYETTKVKLNTNNKGEIEIKLAPKQPSFFQRILKTLGLKS